jgi:DNA-binding transcriptional ArsR family regulator
MSAQRMTPIAIREHANLLAALAHPIRLQIVAALAGDEERTAGSVVDELGLPQPMVSRHLAILRRAGVLSAVRDGRQRDYRIARPEVTALIRLLDGADNEEQSR